MATTDKVTIVIHAGLRNSSTTSNNINSNNTNININLLINIK